MSRSAAVVGVSGIALAIASLLWLPATPVVGYAALFIGASAVFLVTAPALLRASLPGRHLTGLLALLFVLRATFLFTTPVGSDDVYRYLWDGKVQAAGLNPYLHPPAAPALRPLHSDTLPRLVNHPTVKTPYFPLAEWVFRLAHSLSGEAVWGIKLLVLLAEAVTVAGLLFLLRHLEQPAGRVLLYAAAPLAIVQFAIDAHVDAIGLPFFVFGLLLHLRGRTAAGLVLLALSMSVKPVAAVVLPFLFLRARDRRERLAVLLVPGLVIGVQFVPYLGDTGALDGLLRFARSWRFNGSIFNIVRAVARDTPASRLFCGFLLATALAVLAARSRDLATNSLYAVLLLILLSPVVHPWYVAWLAVLVPIAPRWSALALVGTVSLSSATVVTYQLDGVWVDYGLVRTVEYVPVFALLLWEAVAARPRRLPVARG
jgi:hypothetical protein